MPLVYLQLDVSWAYNRKVRKLQRLYPQAWPVYWACYLALLAEAWQRGHDGRKLTVEDAWVPAMPCSPEEAMAALVAAGVTDKAGRIPAASWRQRVEPVLDAIDAKRAGGRKGADKRWNKPPNGLPNGIPNAKESRGSGGNRGTNGRAGARVDKDPTPLSELLTGPLPWQPGGDHD
jgi:hypothetical protein